MIKTFTATTIVIIVSMASGCMVTTSHYRSGESLQEKQIAQIKPGTTTKQQILHWFGPPDAVARKGATLSTPDTGSGKAGGQTVWADTVFELFSAKHNITEDHIIYYYPAHEAKSMAVVVVVAGTSDASVLTDRLWVLIDNRTGTVVDFIFRKANPEAGSRAD